MTKNKIKEMQIEKSLVVFGEKKKKKKAVLKKVKDKVSPQTLIRWGDGGCEKDN